MDCEDASLDVCCDNLTKCQKQLYNHDQRWKQASMFHQKKMAEKDAAIQKLTDMMRRMNEQAKKFQANEAAWRKEQRRAADMMRRMDKQAKKFQAKEAAWQRRAADDSKAAEDAARAEGVRKSREQAERLRRERRATKQKADMEARRAADEAARADGVRRSREEAERQRREFRAAKEEAARKVREEEAARKAKEKADMEARRAAEEAERAAKEAAKAAKSRKEADIARKAERRARERLDESKRRHAKDAKEDVILEYFAKELDAEYGRLSCADIVCSGVWNKFMKKPKALTTLKIYNKIFLRVHPDKVHPKSAETREDFLYRKAMATYWYKRLLHCKEEEWICQMGPAGRSPVQLDSNLSPRSAGVREGVEIVEVYDDNGDNASLVRIEQKLDSLLSMMSELFENKTLSPKRSATCPPGKQKCGAVCDYDCCEGCMPDPDTGKCYGCGPDAQVEKDRRAAELYRDKKDFWDRRYGR